MKGSIGTACSIFGTNSSRKRYYKSKRNKQRNKNLSIIKSYNHKIDKLRYEQKRIEHLDTPESIKRFREINNEILKYRDLANSYNVGNSHSPFLSGTGLLSYRI